MTLDYSLINMVIIVQIGNVRKYNTLKIAISLMYLNLNEKICTLM